MDYEMHRGQLYEMQLRQTKNMIGYLDEVIRLMIKGIVVSSILTLLLFSFLKRHLLPFGNGNFYLLFCSLAACVLFFLLFSLIWHTRRCLEKCAARRQAQLKKTLLE